MPSTIISFFFRKAHDLSDKTPGGVRAFLLEKGDTGLSGSKARRCIPLSLEKGGIVQSGDKARRGTSFLHLESLRFLFTYAIQLNNNCHKGNNNFPIDKIYF